MSAKSYLNSLKKPELLSMAEGAKLPHETTDTVPELKAKLETHLQANSTGLSSASNEYIKNYYERAGLTQKSPLKKIAEKVAGNITSGDEAAPKTEVKKRRKTTTAAVEDDAQALVKSTTSAVTNTIRQAERRSSTILQQASQEIAVSPRRVADAFDQQVTRPVQAQFSAIVQQLHVAEYTDALRDWASSPTAIALLAFLFEGAGIRTQLMPVKPLTEISLSRGSKQTIWIPDLFQLLEANFWAPFLAWLSISVFIPLTAAYFINVPLKVQPSHNYGTRRATAQASLEHQYDPFVFFISKALISYVVLSGSFDLFGLFSAFSIAEVKVSQIGGYENMLISSGIGAALSLYQAVLRK